MITEWKLTSKLNMMELELSSVLLHLFYDFIFSSYYMVSFKHGFELMNQTNGSINQLGNQSKRPTNFISISQRMRR